MTRWVIFDGGAIIGRVHSNLNDAAMAMRYARTIFPDASDVKLKPWDHATKQERAAAKRAQLVRGEMCTRLWSNQEGR